MDSQWPPVRRGLPLRDHLIVLSASLSAAFTLKEVRVDSTLDSKLVVIDGLLRQTLAEVLHLIASHLLCCHDGKSLRADVAKKNILAETWILGILQTTIRILWSIHELELLMATGRFNIERISIIWYIIYIQ